MITVIVPVYNEKSTIRDVIISILELKKFLDLQLIVVDNNSSDGTRSILKTLSKQYQFTLIETNLRGKGIAVRKGLEVAIGSLVSIVDADKEYNPKELLKLIEIMKVNNYRFVLGNRYENQKNVRYFENQRIKTIYYNIGHVLFTKYFNFIFGTKLKDPATMWKIFYLDDIKNHKLSGIGFEFDWEILALLIRKGITPIEIGEITYKSRDHSKGKKIKSFRDPLKWVFYISYYRIKNFVLN
jgi:dolichol-phosphate mannosyltransferase